MGTTPSLWLIFAILTAVMPLAPVYLAMKGGSFLQVCFHDSFTTAILEAAVF